MVSLTASSQRQTHTIKIEIKPENGRGFYGTLDFVYAFENCFGEAHMLYTYKNVNIRTFVYEGRSFTASELKLQSFDKYLISPEIIIDIKKPTLFFKNGQARDAGIEGGISYNVKKGIRLKNVLDTQLAGCYGQTYKAGNYKKAEISNFKLEDKNHLDIKYLYANGIVAYYNWEAILNEKAKCIINNEDCENRLESNSQFEDKSKDSYKNYIVSYGSGPVAAIFYIQSKESPNLNFLENYARNLFNNIRMYYKNPNSLKQTREYYNFNGNVNLEFFFDDVGKCQKETNVYTMEEYKSKPKYFFKYNRNGLCRFERKYVNGVSTFSNTSNLSRLELYLKNPSLLKENEIYDDKGHYYVYLNRIEHSNTKPNNEQNNFDLETALKQFHSLTYEEKLNIIDNALNNFKEQPEIAITFYSLQSQTYILNNEFDKAIQSGKNLLKLVENHNITDAFGSAYYNLAIPYFYKNDIENGAKYINKACNDYNLKEACDYINEYNRLNKN